MGQLNKISIIIILFNLAFWMSCSEDGPIVDEILLTVNKSVALSMGDSILISTQVLSEVDERLQDIPLEYFADDQRLDGPVFYPDKVGVFRISARYQDVISTKKDVEVISLEDNITDLKLNYMGNRFLTTEDWSVSGPFTFDVLLDNQAFQVSTNNIDLLVNGSPVEERTSLHFDTPGTYSVEAAFGNLRSDPVQLEVREKLQLTEIVIPLIFHDFGQNLDQGQLQGLLDTLNRAFNLTYKKEDVEEGVVNPNAVNMKLTFEFAEDSPEGFDLSGKGIHRISNQEPIVDLTKMVEENTWDPQKYVNIWMFTDTDVLDFESFGPYPWVGRGFASKPLTRDFEIPGLRLADANELDLNPGIALGVLSVFGEHPDYIVSLMGYYFGLLNTNDEQCANHGDFVEDTRTLTFDSEAPTNYYFDCEDQLMRATNFMAIGRRYRDFTYDQALRIRSVMEHGVSRVGLE